MMIKSSEKPVVKTFFDFDRKEFLSLGEGQIGYVRLLDDKDMERFSDQVSFSKAWGVYSASGETLAICDSPAAAWSFFADHELLPVSLH